MVRMIRIALSLMFIVSFSIALQAQELLKQEYHKNGQLKSTITRYDKEIQVVNYYDNGRMKERFYFIDFKRHGVFEAWHSDGSKHMTIAYENNKPSGQWQVWNNSGQLIAEALFENGNLKSGHMWDKEGNPIAFQE